MHNRTKKLLAETIQQMAKTKPIKDIQIKDLCRKAEIERTTFYYHFCDKYELITWIFEQMFYEEANNSIIINSEEMIFKMAKRIQKKKAFFKNALSDDSQNNLRQYMVDFYIRSEEDVVKKYLQSDKLDDDTFYTLRAYSYGCMGLTIDWLLDKTELTPEQFAYHQYRLMPELIKNAYHSISINETKHK